MAKKPKTARRVKFHLLVPVISTAHAPSAEDFDELSKLNSNSPSKAVIDTCRPWRSSIDDVPKQTVGHAPALPVAIESGRLLIDAHDQSDAML